MHRVSQASYRHLAPPYRRVNDEWVRDVPRQELRKLRKRLGLPASEDASVIGKMAVALKEKTEEILGHRIGGFHVAASFPRYVALYAEEVLDGLEWAGLRYRQVTHSATYGDTCILRQASSAYAGIGLGLCSDYKNTSACVHELFPSFPPVGKESILIVTLSLNALIVEWFNMIHAYYLSNMFEMYDFSLGSSQADSIPGYWEVVRNALKQHFAKHEWQWLHNTPRKVFISGESSNDPDFLSVLEDAVSWNGDELAFYKEDIDFLLANGTAELAKRAEYLDWRDMTWQEKSLALGRDDIDPWCWASGKERM